MASEEINKILADMEKHGFPLEVRTSVTLQTYGWEVTNQASYIDMDSKKNRTIDIIAEKNVILNSSKLGFDIWLFIECKKAQKPWVFYTSDMDLTKEDIRRKVVSSAHVDINSLAYQQRKQNIVSDIILRQFLLEKKLSKSFFAKIAYSSFEPFTKGKGLSINKARMQVCNAILDVERKIDSEILPTIDFPYGLLFLPIIVLDGQLLTYENGKLSFSDGLYYHVPYHGDAFLIEIITANFLETYLKKIEFLTTNFKYEYLPEVELNSGQKETQTKR